MGKQWLGVCLFMIAASTAHAQQWPGSYNPYYYGYPQAQRYYNPYASSAYYAAPRPNYYYNPASQYGYSPYYRAPNSAGGTVYYPVQRQSAAAENAGDVSVQAAPIGTAAPLDGPMLPAVPLERGNGARIRKTSQGEEMMLPPGAPAPEHDRGNIAMIWDKVCGAIGPIGPEAPPSRPERHECMWVSGGYVAAYLRPMRLAGPLITTGSINDSFPGSLGQSSTSVLFGSDPVNFGLASGGTFTVGVFLDGSDHFSLEATGVAIFPTRQTFNFASDSNGNPLLARPAFSTDEARQGSFAIAVPGLITGQSRIDFSSMLSGGEINARYYGCCGSSCRYDFLLGARYARLAERMRIIDNYDATPGNTVLFNGNEVTSIYREDSFSTTNHFIGGQIGARLAYDCRWLDVSGFAKLGLGATLQQVNIDGTTTGTLGYTSQTATGGVLALPSNIGNYSRTVFGLMPELGLTLRVNVTDNFRVQMGYSAMLWNSVVRPGTSYSTKVNDGLAPSSLNHFGDIFGPIAPTFRFNDEVFWTHSMNLGVEFHF